MTDKKSQEKTYITIVVTEKGELLSTNYNSELCKSLIQDYNLLSINESITQNDIYKIEKLSFNYDDKTFYQFILTEKDSSVVNQFENYIDIFTGLYNRNFWECVLNHKIKLIDANKYTLAIIDVDNLKELNDNHGHSAGDIAIKSLADSFLYVLERNCYPIRYGGDEFIIVFPDKTYNEIRQILDNIKEIVYAFFDNKKYNFDISFSYGLASTKNIDLFRKAFDSADKKMFQNKTSNKNGKD